MIKQGVLTRCVENMSEDELRNMVFVLLQELRDLRFQMLKWQTTFCGFLRDVKPHLQGRASLVTPDEKLYLWAAMAEEASD